MTNRSITSVLVIFLLIVVIKLGPIAVGVATFLVSIRGLYELYRAGQDKFSPISWVAYAVSVFLYIGYFIGGEFGLLLFIIQASLVVILAVSLFSKHSIRHLTFTYFGIVYILVPIFYVNLLMTHYGTRVLYFSFLIPVASDVFAYLVGRLIGKRPLIPDISPNKTIEGAIGGLVASIIFSLIYTVTLIPELFGYSVYLGLVGGVLSQAGDLIASKMKRDFDIKDFGNILPGHGGILDRFDSLVVIFPFMYFVIRMIGFTNINVPFY